MELAAAGAIIAGSVWMALVGDRGFQVGRAVHRAGIGVD